MKPRIVSAADGRAPNPGRDHVIITCEHGGNRIPPLYKPLFEPFAQMLTTHRGYDAGALGLARDMAGTLHAPLFFSTTSRLLVDLNRSIGHPALHSEATRELPLTVRRQIVEGWWRPHRDRVESQVAAMLIDSEGRTKPDARVVHIASHSFTPELHGEVRNADIGLLYDPRRKGEGVLARLWKRQLEAALPEMRVRLNYPYAGKSDGLTSTLRRAYPAECYVGIESELNQKHVSSAGSASPVLRHGIVDALARALTEFAEIGEGQRQAVSG